MAYGSRSYGGQRRSSGSGAQGERWPSFNADPASVHPFKKTTKDGREFDMMIVHLPDGTNLSGRDLTGFSISVFQGRYTREQLDQGRPVYVSFRPGRSVEVFRGRYSDPDYQRIDVDDPAELVAAVKQAQEAMGPAPSSGQGGGPAGGYGAGRPASGGGYGQTAARPQRIGFIGKRDESGNLVPDQNKVAAMNAQTGRGTYGQGERWPSFTIANAAVHPFTRTARNGRTYDMMVVNIPEGTIIDGHDLGGFSVSAFQNKRTKAQLSAGEDVTVSLRPGQPVDLFKGRRSDPDYQTYGVPDPEILAKAVETALAASGEGGSSATAAVRDEASAAWGGQSVSSAASTSAPAASGAWGGAADSGPSRQSVAWGDSAAAQPSSAYGAYGAQEDDPWAASAMPAPSGRLSASATVPSYAAQPSTPASASASVPQAQPTPAVAPAQDASLDAWSSAYMSSPVTADDEASFDQDGYDEDGYDEDGYGQDGDGYDEFDDPDDDGTDAF